MTDEPFDDDLRADALEEHLDRIAAKQDARSKMPMQTPGSHWPHIAARLAGTEGLSPAERRKAVATVLLHEFDLSEQVVDTALDSLAGGIEKAGPRGILIALAVAALHLFKSE